MNIKKITTYEECQQQMIQAAKDAGYALGLLEAIEYLESLGLYTGILEQRKESFGKNAKLRSERIEEFLKEQETK